MPPRAFASRYASYKEAGRAPTAIEPGCADPTEPCDLPKALVSDPPLKQVVTRTFEVGARGTLEKSKLRSNAGWLIILRLEELFHGVNYNDILFVGSQQTGFGYFSNFGETRRQGAEAGISDHFGKFTLGGNYIFLSATYQARRSSMAAATARTTPGRVGSGWQYHGPARIPDSSNAAQHFEGLRGV
jgi:hypothetical protein